MAIAFPFMDKSGQVPGFILMWSSPICVGGGGEGYWSRPMVLFQCHGRW